MSVVRNVAKINDLSKLCHFVLEGFLIEQCEPSLSPLESERCAVILNFRGVNLTKKVEFELSSSFVITEETSNLSIQPENSVRATDSV